MKLYKFILLHILVLLSCYDSRSQSPYLGGSGCGVAKSTYGQATMNIFGGGSADGYSKLNKAQTDLVNTNLGGIADGYSLSFFSQPDQVSLFLGGLADGYSKLHYTQLNETGMFFGGIADGYSKSLYSQNTLSNLFYGGIADGYAKSTYAQADPATPDVNFIASDTTICVGTCINFTDMSSNGPTSWNWSFPGASTTSSTLQNPVNICYNVAGTYSVKLKATNIIGADSTTKTAYITVSPLPVANAGTDIAICNGASTTLNASGGNTYSWLPATGLSSTTISNPVASPASTTSYTVTATSVAGCVSTDVVVVTVKPLPAVSVSPITICAGTSGTLTATGASSYSWANAGGLSSTSGATVTANPATTTTYTVTGTLNGCNNTTSVVVTVTPAPPADGGTNATICSGSSVTLNASGGTAYSWSPAATLSASNISNPVASPAITTTYTVTVTGGGCAATDVITVTVTPLPAANAGTDVTICNGASTTLSASGGTSYSWSPGAGLSSTTISNPVANPASTTTYTVTVSASGCSKTDVVVVNVVSPPTADAGNDIAICNGSSTTLSASGGTSYSWSPSAGLNFTSIANPIASPVSTTTYTVTVTSAGCSSTDAVVVIVNSLPTANAGSDATICNGLSTALSASGGTSYTWSPVSGLSSSVISNPIASPASTTNYVVTVTDVNGCQSSDAVMVNVNTVAADAGSDVTICTGSSTTMSASGGTSYSWSPGTGLSSTSIANPVANPTATTSYTVTVTNAGCTATDVVVVSVNSSLTADAGTDVSICSGSSTNLSASGGASYSWSPSTGLNFSNIANPSASPSSTTTYTVTVSSGGCSSTDQVVVTVNSLPAATINVSGATTFCAGDSVILSTSTGTSYTWSNGANTSQITVTASGNYSVTVSNVAGCSATSAITSVTVNPAGTAAITANGPAAFCQGDSVTLTANTGNSYNWSTGATTQSVTVSTGGTYTVTVADINGCNSPSASINIIVNPNPAIPVITTDGTTSLCVGDSVILSSDPANSYLWNTGATDSAIIVSSAGLYSVTNYNSFGCGSTSGSITVNVNDPLVDFTATPLLVFIPTANVSFSAATAGVPPYTYLWNFGDGGTSTAASPSHTYGNVAYQTVSLTLTDSTGCSKTLTKPGYVEVEQLFPSYAMNTGTTLDLTGVSFLDAQTGVMSLTDGNCLISLDSGNNWSPLPTGNNQPLKGIRIIPGHWFATGANGTILHSIDDGATWIPYSTGTTETFNSSSFTSASNGFAVGTNGIIQKYNGTNWTPEISGTSDHLNNVFALSNGEAFAVGDNQTILKYDGSSWSPQTSPINFNPKDVRFSSLLKGYAAGSNGVIIKTIDGGITWTPSLTGVDIDFNSIEVSGTDSAWAAGTNGIVYTTADDGLTWIRYSVGYTADQKEIRVKGGKGHVVGHGGNGRNFGERSAIITGINHDVMNVINNFNVYPNPANESFNISALVRDVTDLKIELRDTNGKLLKTFSESHFSGHFETTISTENYRQGIYFVHVRQGERSWVKKIVIVK